MRARIVVVLLVIIGIVGAWVGYWVGHALGWTTDAEFPFRIGAGEQAIGLSILASFASVMAGLAWFVALPLVRLRRLLETGSPGHATVRRFWRTGLSTRGAGGGRRELAFELEVHPDGGRDYPAKALGLLSEAEEAELGPGAEVVVRYDPAHPNRVAVAGPLMPSAL
jgi:uncharacterized membrane protein YeaQ/YmgE (transglycosylase-associated protein family)